jgi:endoglycosylceramidase
MRARLVVGVVLLSVTAGCAPARALPLLSHHGRWLTDPQGRVAILHGVQIDKLRANAPIRYVDITPANVSFIGAEGFNVARVSMTYAGVEPVLAHFEDSYIREYLTLDRLLAGAGVYDQVDMMQGQYAGVFWGDGFPNWMVFTDGLPNLPGPFPQSYIYDPAEERAWDNFWANVQASDHVGLQDHFARGLRYLARLFAGQPAFLGFDLLNEPWAGSHWPSCANPLGCPLFDRELNAFYKRIIPTLRIDDPHHLVFYEPHALFDQGAASNIGAIGDPNAVFTFHNYCLGDQPGLPQADPGQNCGIEEQLVLAHAEAQAARGTDGLLENEWGNTPSVPLLQRMAVEADQHMIGWSYWAYEDCCRSPGAVVYDGSKDPTTPGNLNLPVLRALVRPYPKLIAGTPTAWSFDLAAGKFTLSYTTSAVAGGVLAPSADTEIELPALQYPTGYSVRVTGARVLSAPDANLLRLANLPGTNTVKLAVTTAVHHPNAAGPFTWPTAASVPADCPASTRLAVPIHYRGRQSATARVLVHIDGRLVSALPARRVHQIILPPGLADGTQVELVLDLHGKQRATIRQLRSCVLSRQPARTIDTPGGLPVAYAGW